MSKTAYIFIRWLWRFQPMIWLDWIVRYLIHWCIGVLEDHREWLEQDRTNAAWFGGWLALAEARLDELIAIRASRHLRYRWQRREPWRHVPVPGVRGFSDAARRLGHLMRRYHHLNRLVASRAAKLKRMIEAKAIQLETIHHPIDLQSVSAGGAGVGGVGVSEIRVAGVQLQPDARIRAPPRLPLVPEIQPTPTRGAHLRERERMSDADLLPLPTA